MATSGTYSFTVNRDQLIRQAMLNIGKLDPLDSPTAQEVSDCAFVLNMLVKQWMGKTDFAPGLKVWTRKRGYLFLRNTTGQYSVGSTATGWTNSFVNPVTTAVAALGSSTVVVSTATGIVIGYNIGVQYGTNSIYWTTVANVVGTTVTLTGTLPGQSNSGSEIYCYQTAGTQPLQIEAAVLRDSSNNDTPLNIMQQPEYDSLPNKTDPTNLSDPTAVYYENQLGNSYLYTDCGAANDITKYIVLTYLEPVQDFNNPADNPEYPQEWYLSIAWGLAMQIAPMFNAIWTPAMQAAYSTALLIAQRKDSEHGTMYFQINE